LFLRYLNVAEMLEINQTNLENLKLIIVSCYIIIYLSLDKIIYLSLDKIDL